MKLAKRLGMHGARLLVAIAAVTVAISSGYSDQPPLAYGVFAVEVDGQISQPLADVLQAGDANSRIATFASLNEAVNSPAEVLVIYAPRSRDQYPPDILQGLKKKKVIGIGYGAAQIFEKLELEIRGGACAHFGGGMAGIQTQRSLLLENGWQSQEIAPYVKSSASDNFGMYIPAGSDETLFVDVIARVPGKENYAPIVRQHNFVMVGLSAPPSDWSDDYRRLFRDVASAMLKRTQEPFKKPEFPLLGPGKHVFTLAKGGSTKEPFSKTHYYKFTEPTLFTATLEQTGSTNMMLIFMGEKDRLHWTREDARNGEPLTIVVDISEDDLKRMGDNYWTLKATNFDRDNRSACVLSVQYGE